MIETERVKEDSSTWRGSHVIIHHLGNISKANNQPEINLLLL